MSMRIRAAFVIIAIVFAFTAASFFLNLSFTQQNITYTMEQDLSLALDIADNVVTTKISLLKSNAHTMAARIDAVTDAEMTEVMAAQLEEFGDFISITVYDQTGFEVNYGESINHDVFLAGSEYIAAAFKGESRITSAHYDGTDGNLVIHIFVPMENQRVLSATIPGMYFSDILKEYRLWQSGSIFMVDEEGTFIANFRSELVLEQRNFIEDSKFNHELDTAGEFYKNMITNDHGSGRYSYEGEDRLCIYKHVSGSKSGWYIGVTAPLNESPLRNIQNGLLLSALFFLAAGVIVSIIVSGIVIKPFQTIQAQAAQIQDEHERLRVMLDATPLACRLWNKDFRVFDCNDESVKLFGFKSKQEYMEKYFDLSPEFQADGQKSSEKINKILDQVFKKDKDEKIVFEWMHQKMDGTTLPVEITLVRVKFGEETVIAGYTRDLREYKQMMNEIERNTNMLNTMNQIANILLQPESDEFQNDLLKCMGMIGKPVNADRVCIWKNKIKDGKLYCDLLYDWPGGTGSLINSDFAVSVSYDDNIPGWEKILSQGKCINNSIGRLSPEEQKQLKAHGVKSLFVAPVFVRGEFWGYVGFDNYHEEKLFTEEEASTLYSASLLIANSLVRNEMMLNIREASMKLEDALEEATRANKAKSSFLANMSHEMRTPLNAIIGLTDLALGNDKLDEENFSVFEKLNNSGMTLLSTVNDILDISKIESGKFELIPVVYDIPSLINDTVTQSIMHKSEKPIEFILNIDGNLPAQLNGDDLRIKQILNNLLSNAFKYTKEGTVELGINCTCENVNETVWINAYVKDTGIGINPEFIGNIFDNYAQTDMKANRKIMGTGLGLSITKMMVDLMKGTIDVKSEYGKGSVFTVKIPQRYVGETVIGTEMADNLKNFIYYEQKRKKNSQIARISLPYARVLIVDDVVTNLDVAKGLMKPYGMQIDCVKSGQEAINAIQSENVRYNAVFMDHMMPGMDGIEATRIIREIDTDYAKKIPIIALTANAVSGNEEMFLSKGFQAFISKPIELTRLDAVIRKWVRDKNQEKLIADYNNNNYDSQDLEKEQERRIISNRRSGLDRRKVNMNLTGLDIAKGIERFGGNKETFFQLLHSYMLHTRPLLDSITDINEEQLANYAITVHGIKGSSRSICADTIGSAAENLEKAAKAGDFSYIKAHNNTFLKAAWKLIFDLEDLLSNINEINPKPVKNKPDEETLSKLLNACKTYNMDDVDDAMAEMEKYQYDADNGLASWLIDNIKQMNFKQIIEKLSDTAE